MSYQWPVPRSPLVSRHIYNFWVLSEELHFARAAEALEITTGQLSKDIKELETIFKTKLFTRANRQTKLTIAGKNLQHHMIPIMACAAQMHRAIEALESGVGGRIAIAINGSAAGSPLTADFLRQCFRRRSEYIISIVQKELADQIWGLQHGRVDAGLVCSPSSDPMGYQSLYRTYKLWSEPAAVAMNSSNPLAKQDVVRVIEPAWGPLIVVGEPDEGGGALAELNEVLKTTTSTRCHLECGAGTELLLTRVASGNGLGLLSKSHAATINRAEVVIRPLDIGTLRMTTYLITGISFSPEHIRRFLSTAKEIASKDKRKAS